MMRRSLPALALFGIGCLAVVTLTPGAAGFGTLNKLGQNAEHEHITRAALGDFDPRTLNEIAGATGSFGAVGAPDNPVRGLLFSSEAHCDNGDYLDPGKVAGSQQESYPQSASQAAATLTRCRDWIKHWLDEAVRSAEPLTDPGRINTSLGCVFNGEPGRAKCNVLDNLGVAFHAAQDFYAHTNWVDRPADGPVSVENPPGLGNAGHAPWLDPRKDFPFPSGLMSGCFQALPESLFCNDRVRHAAINKDLGPISDSGAAGTGKTPRGAVNDNFQRAVNAAVEDTQDKWAYFQQRVRDTYGSAKGDRIICVVRSDNYRRC
jgi:hypothetical protein